MAVDDSNPMITGITASRHARRRLSTDSLFRLWREDGE